MMKLKDLSPIERFIKGNEGELPDSIMSLIRGIAAKPTIPFLDRRKNPLPPYQCRILVVYKDRDGEEIWLCNWHPFDPSKYTEKDMPADGYLGTARVVEKGLEHIGFHAWAQNDSEFVFYLTIERPV